MEIQGPFDPNRIRLLKQRQADQARGKDAATSGGGDRLEISEVGKRLNSINLLPEVRAERIAQLKEELRAGTLDTPEKLREAIRSFLEDAI